MRYFLSENGPRVEVAMSRGDELGLLGHRDMFLQWSVTKTDRQPHRKLGCQ